MFKLIFLLLFALGFFIVGAVIYVIVVGLLYILSTFMTVIIGAVIIIAVIISATLGLGRDGLILVTIGIFTLLVIGLILHGKTEAKKNN